MLLRRRACALVIFAAIFILMLASQSIQRGTFLPLSISLPVVWSTPWEQETALVSAVHLAAAAAEDPPSGPGGPGGPGGGPPDPEGHAVETSQKSRKSCGCPDSCISDPTGSQWFSQRYDPDQWPVLHKSNNSFGPGVLKWWLGLQASGISQSLEGVLNQLFEVISPPAVQLRPLPSRCRSCAVVGNSGKLRHSANGKLIDSHDSVLRMNKAITKGFEQDVGNRTTHHILYPESAVDLAPGVSLVLLPFKLRDLEWLASALSTGTVTMTYMRVKERVEADRDKVLVVNPAFFKYVTDRWTEHHGRYPSTGMLTIVFALHICDQVSVFGYGADQQGNWHHYWEENRNAGAFRKTGVHNADFEMQLIQRLAKEGKISLHL